MAAKKKQTAKKKEVKKAPAPRKTVKAKSDPASKQADSASRVKQSFPIVGIGASAGGLEAIEGFFAHTPSDIGIAFVIIQHLAPEHKSIMGSLLKKYTNLKVAEVRDGMKIEPGCVYLNPPNKEVSTMNGRLHLSEPTQARGARLAIDYFFRSLAEAEGDKSICIVLSGAGTDGTLGLKAIKGAGGMAMVQEEIQAKYNNMPRSAIDTGLVDYILPVEKMAAELIKYVKHPYIGGTKKVLKAKEKFEDYLQKIFMLIRSTTGHDFSQYKMNTIRRRIERRMAVHQMNKISEYVAYMKKNPAEVKTLFKDLLITVTNFFRDPEAFKSLNDRVIIPLVKAKPPEAFIRVWVVGCATGEEAYSVAILFSEAMKLLTKRLTLQIFATDIDADAIEHARLGVYPDSIAADVSPERLKAYFVREENAYRVKKQIREMVVFATQNLVKDAPFSKLDLVCCRNVLIYMNTALQKKILPLFHYTLNPGGYLFLGTSETTGEFADLFSAVDLKWKISRRKPTPVSLTAARLPLPLNGSGAEVREEAKRKFEPTSANVRQLAERIILQEFAPPCVLIDEKFDVLYFNGDTDKYLSVPMGEPTFNVLKIAREEIRYKLSTLVHKSLKEKKPVRSEETTIRYNGSVSPVNIVVKPVLDPSIKNEFMMILFETPKGSAEQSGREKHPPDRAVDPRVATLERELQSTKEYLQTTVEELETSNEELKSTNEELQSTNEELQSTNEELETSREELQSTNEELETVNNELRNKVEQLSEANNDLNNLLGCTEIATLFLDNDVKIKRFTPRAAEIFKLIAGDVGRPISDIVHNLLYDDLVGDVEDILKNLGRIEKEVQAKNGNWYLMRILPYRTIENAIDGVVITFVDITSQKRDQQSLQESEEKCSALINQTQAGIVLADVETGLITEGNPAFERLTGRNIKALKTMKMWELRPSEKLEEAKKAFFDAVKKKKGSSTELPFRRPDGQVVDVDCVYSLVVIRDKRYMQTIIREIDKPHKP
ncbi:MAG: CheR family methyltransferase [Sedimentisphaerales bacterium]